jgi:hypothetical protein
MKSYSSKNEIYKDYAIALKFFLQYRVNPRYYDDLYKTLAHDYRAKVIKFSSSVKNFRTKYPISAGFFVEIPVRGDTGKEEIGTRFVLLEHETGWEVFIPIVSTIIGYTFAKFGEKILDKVLEQFLNKLQTFFKITWGKFIRGGVKIDYVEIRTKNKGVMRIPFYDFDVKQVFCLIKKFKSIKHLWQCNDECFNGKLVDPPETPFTSQADD